MPPGAGTSDVRGVGWWPAPVAGSTGRAEPAFGRGFGGTPTRWTPGLPPRLPPVQIVVPDASLFAIGIPVSKLAATHIAMNPRSLSPWVAAGLLVATSCSNDPGSSGGGSDGQVVGKFTILGTKTDETDKSVAKQNAENALLLHSDLDGMVGLWAYNAPQCLDAIRGAGKLGEVAVFAFDEDEATLQGIIDGHIAGTVVQQPYEFGYQSMKYLAMINRGEEVDVPEDKLIDIPAKTITKSDAQSYWDSLKELQGIGKAAESAPKPESDLRFAFVINNPDPFWSYARAGCYKAEQDFGIIADFEAPHDGSATAQNRILENLLQKGGYSGVAVSPIDPANQTATLNEVAASMPLICHDSDAPESERRFYLGTNNYEAGRLLGKLVKKTLPDGGKLMIFVGKIDVLNARQRREGLLDELAAE